MLLIHVTSAGCVVLRLQLKLYDWSVLLLNVDDDLLILSIVYVSEAFWTGVGVL